MDIVNSVCLTASEKKEKIAPLLPCSSILAVVGSLKRHGQLWTRLEYGQKYTPRRKDSDSGPGISEMEILNSNLRTDHTKIAAKAINNSSTGIVASLARFGVIASRYLWRRKGGNLDQHTMMIDPGIYEA